MKKLARILLVFFVISTLSGCLSPIVLNRAVEVYDNAAIRAGYEMFRRIVLNFSTIQDQKQLYAEPLTFERSWTIPSRAISPEGLFQAIEKDFTVSHDQQKGTYTLSKQLPGPILITNYDPRYSLLRRAGSVI